MSSRPDDNPDDKPNDEREDKFDLHVTFSGLTLLVPLKATNELWALMLEHKAKDANGKVDKEHNHEACLILPPPFATEDTFQYWSVEGLTNSFTAPKPGGDVSLMLRTVGGNLSRSHAFKAPHDQGNGNWFDPNAAIDARFTARVQLTNVHSIVATGGRYWNYPPWGIVRLATHVTAVLPDMPGTSIDAKIADGASPLRVRASSGIARVGFMNLPTQELESPSEGTEPAKDDPPKHFGMLKKRLDIADTEHPKYVRPQPKHRGKEPSLGIRDDGMVIRGVNPYACLTLPGCPDSESQC